MKMTKRLIPLVFSLLAIVALLCSAVSAAEFTGSDGIDPAALSVSGLLEGTDTISLYRSAPMGSKSMEDAVVDAMLDFQPVIDVSAYGFNVADLDSLRTFFSYLLSGHAELFHVNNSYSYSYNTSGKIVSLKVKYLCTPQEYTVQRQVLDEGIAKMVAAAAGCTTDEQIALAIHDYLVLNYRYDTDYVNYDVYSFIRDGKGVCQCYSRAFTKALSYYGIEAGSVTSDELGHEWNYIVLDGEIYHVDVTWDDPLYGDGTVDFPAKVSHNNFLCSDAGITATGHTSWETDITASSAKYDGMWWKVIDTPMPVSGGAIFAADYGEDIYTFPSLTADLPSVLFSVSDIWNVYDENTGSYTGYYYTGKFVSLGAYNGKLYYNTPDAVMERELSTGKTRRFASLDKSLGLGYGMFVTPDGRITVAQSFVPHDYVCTLTAFDIVPVEESCPHLHVSLIYNADGHRYFCSDCEKEVGKLFAHVFDDDHDADCNECGYVRQIMTGTVTRGDVNGDGNLNNADAVYLLRYIMLGDTYPINQGGDMNGDGNLNNADAVYLLRYIMLGDIYPLAADDR